MKSDPKSPYAVLYLDKDFAYTGGTHNIDNLILIGWLLCKHWSDETQSYELWHIINPQLAPHVTKREVLTVITRLAYIAVNLNQRMIKNLPGSEGKDKALIYHKRIAENRKEFLKEIGASIQEQVTQDCVNTLLD